MINFENINHIFDYFQDEEELNKKGKHKQLLDIEINFNQSEGRDYPRRNRGGRGPGGPRGERGDRRGDRGDRGEGRGAQSGRGRFDSQRNDKGPYRGKKQAAPKVDDWNDFPSLAAA